MKEFDTRLCNKRDTASNWQAYNPLLLDGEIAIVDVDSNQVRFKIGDGTNHYNSLSFTDEDSRPDLFTITLTASGWNSTSLTQQASNAHFTISSAVYITNPVEDDKAVWSSAGVAPRSSVTTAGQLEFTCSTIPTSDIEVNVLKIKQVNT